MTLKEILEIYKKGALEGHKETMVSMSEQSLQECPLDEGPLRNSYRVDLNGEGFLAGNKSGELKKVNDVKTVEEDYIESNASYSTDYAIIQHEDLTFYHPTPGTKAKYLEDPAKRARGEYRKNIIKAIKEAK